MPIATPSRPADAPLYVHEPHPHQPRNANAAHAEERAARVARHSGWHGRVSAFNLWLAVWLTKHTGTMATAYLFAGIGIGSLVGVFTGNVFLAALFGSISSYFLQLVLLPILSVGQNVLSRHAELQADQQFHATMRTLHENSQIMRHLDAQDAELLRQTTMLATLLAHTHANAANVSAVSASAPQTPETAAPPTAPARPPRRPRKSSATPA